MMTKNPNNLHDGAIDMHRDQINDIIDGFYPPDNEDERNTHSDSEIDMRKFETFQDWIGHDLLVNAIFAGGKTTGNQRMQVFEDALQGDEWREFEDAEVRLGHAKPDPHAQYPILEKKDTRNKRKGSNRKEQKQKGKTTGKVLL